MEHLALICRVFFFYFKDIYCYIEYFMKKVSLHRRKIWEDNGESTDQSYNDTVKQSKQNSDKEATASLSDFSSNKSDDVPNFDISAANPESKNLVKTLANKASSIPGMKGATITIHESVEFTKNELSDWLRSF